ncbi:MAG TPA: biotin--[acetyl-CoA-carboxylase] ligase [Candidatus Pacearchaeota archaeon]|nr:biotin--[acetyl-CoA-carboxylase] ligase [Candidatus Pacearchaeota archaeon]
MIKSRSVSYFGGFIKMIGDNLISLDKVTSTNKFLKENWHKLPSETVVWALEQTEAYGRKKDKWYAPFGGLWFSVLFKPRKRPLIPFYYVRMYSLAVLDLLKKRYKLDAIIKWPNDILVEEKKICGILGESIYNGNNPACVIVGVGMNVNNDLPEEIASTSVSLKQLIGKEAPLNKILSEINHIAYHSYYLKYFKPKTISNLTKIWLKNLNIKKGDKVKLKTLSGRIVIGELVDIKSDCLEILDASGEIKVFNSGEISVII